MIVHVEYENLKKFEKLFALLSKKYSVKLAGFCFHFDKKSSIAPYRFLRKKIGQICYQLPTRLLSAKLISLCNRLRLDLNIIVDSALTKSQKALLQTLERATVVYCNTQDEQTNAFLNEQKNLLVCSKEKDCALQADLFHLAVYNRQQYQCKCSSCLSNVLYITKENDVCFCPFYPNESKLCSTDYDGDYFDNEAFVQVLTKQIQSRDECKKSCDYYSVCHGGCAMKDVCPTVKTQYPVMQQRAKQIKDVSQPLSDLPLYEKEGVLRGVSQGK